MWVDRLTGQRIGHLPEVIESGRYLAEIVTSDQSTVNLGASGLLVDDGSEIALVDGQRKSIRLPDKALAQKVELFERILETIDSSIEDEIELVSPLMPEGVVDNDSHLNSFDSKLLTIIEAGHLHQISMRPRLDLYYEEEVTDVARAKKLARGALVHLASHSECWQRQTLTGVIPKRVKARFSDDDFNIYENRVYARLLDKIDQYLSKRVGTLRQIQSAVSEALEFYGTNDRHHRLTEEICRLWGKAFTQDSTSKASEQLSKTLDKLENALGIIRGLKQRGLYLLVSRSAQIGDGLHLTNILSHDQHYRHLPILWNELRNIVGGKRITPDERRERNEGLNRAYSKYAGLVLRHALTPYLGVKLSSTWAGFNLELKQVGFNWQLLVSTADTLSEERVLLEVVPWMGFVGRPVDFYSLQNEKQNYQPLRMLAWPNLCEDSLHSNQAVAEGAWVLLSPFDLYGVERFGYLVDKLLQRELVSDYGRALIKIPAKTIGVAAQLSGLEVSAEKHEIKVLDALAPADFAKIERSLVNENALEQAWKFKKRHEEIMELQKCPICSGFVKLKCQKSTGFSIDCTNCKTQRYLRTKGEGQEYEQILSGNAEFKKVGRRSFIFEI
ncbi:hypothetical protein RN347_02285 [Halomonas sp. PAMB 3264]|uniref:hypothetical protein n=1 Tax=Halomonas sp. PAMB 3264 TaxID=3075222 RepID=UPI00289FA79E|nr:hypothetical protein [Halomonas sp. PAMB 3264]WNL42742.1 hypothetical protein RN347_02285 [Halomonas sp. PAMB 3264]